MNDEELRAFERTDATPTWPDLVAWARALRRRGDTGPAEFLRRLQRILVAERRAERINDDSFAGRPEHRDQGPRIDLLRERLDAVIRLELRRLGRTIRAIGPAGLNAWRPILLWSFADRNRMRFTDAATEELRQGSWRRQLARQRRRERRAAIQPQSTTGPSRLLTPEEIATAMGFSDPAARDVRDNAAAAVRREGRYICFGCMQVVPENVPCPRCHP